MYYQEQETTSIADARLASVAVRDVSAIQRALNEHGEQIEKLSSLVNAVMNRLEPVRLQQPSDDAQDTREPLNTPGTSMLTNQVMAQTQTVKNLQTALDILLSELEV